jgi:hypothetical protein
MLELGRALATRLQELGVRVDVLDGDTVILRDVPADARFFNKTHTNLLLKRPAGHMPFVACVDEDLEYTGPDPSLDQAFRTGIRRGGWLAILLGNRPRTDFHDAATNVLCALGFDEREPAVIRSEEACTPRPVGGLFTTRGINLSELARNARSEPVFGRESEITEAASCLIRWGQTRMAVIVGESGVGKTNLLYGVAEKLLRSQRDLSLTLFDLGGLFAGTLFDAEREHTLRALLTEALTSSAMAVAVEHVELALYMPHGPAILSESIDAGARIIGTTLPLYLPKFAIEPLARRLQVIELPEMSPKDTAAVLQAVAGRIAVHHHLEIDESCVSACVRACRSLPGVFPAKAIRLLDAAAALATLTGATVISPDEIYSSAEGAKERGDGVE